MSEKQFESNPVNMNYGDDVDVNLLQKSIVDASLGEQLGKAKKREKVSEIPRHIKEQIQKYGSAGAIQVGDVEDFDDEEEEEEEEEKPKMKFGKKKSKKAKVEKKKEKEDEGEEEGDDTDSSITNKLGHIGPAHIEVTNTKHIVHSPPKQLVAAVKKFSEGKDDGSGVDGVVGKHPHLKMLRKKEFRGVVNRGGKIHFINAQREDDMDATGKASLHHKIKTAVYSRLHDAEAHTKAGNFKMANIHGAKAVKHLKTLEKQGGSFHPSLKKWAEHYSKVGPKSNVDKEVSGGKKKSASYDIPVITPNGIDFISTLDLALPQKSVKGKSRKTMPESNYDVDNKIANIDPSEKRRGGKYKEAHLLQTSVYNRLNEAEKHATAGKFEKAKAAGVKAGKHLAQLEKLGHRMRGSSFHHKKMKGWVKHYSTVTAKTNIDKGDE